MFRHPHEKELTLNTLEASKQPPSESWVSIGELQVRHLDWGGPGTPVILLHGLASSAHWYDLVAPYLREHYRIIAPTNAATARLLRQAMVTIGGH